MNCYDLADASIIRLHEGAIRNLEEERANLEDSHQSALSSFPGKHQPRWQISILSCALVLYVAAIEEKAPSIHLPPVTQSRQKQFGLKKYNIK